ncbi:hypothetical protein DL96DRAFT_1622989 [Flagelloscypha sp. PMI_526]|nr:hypothetical protein DL96DRAFT_1622989 [Flagelloscypha sp. PMI_526]
MERIPPELLSQILSFLVHDDVPIRIRRHPGFLNNALISPSLATSALRNAASPILWSSLVLPVSSLPSANTFLDILSNSQNICHWISDICFPDAPSGLISNILSRVICLLPAIRRVDMKALSVYNPQFTAELAGWDVYPIPLLRTLEESIFPSITYLNVQDLHSIPIANLLQSCPQLTTLDLTRQEVNNADHPPFRSLSLGRTTSKVSGLKHLILRGFFAEGYLRQNPEKNAFAEFGDTSVRLTELTLNAVNWYEEYNVLARPILMSHASTLEKFTFRWSNIYLDSDFPRSLFQGCHFPSLSVIYLSLEWKFVHPNSDIFDDTNMRDIAELVSLAPVLRTLRIHFKPPRRDASVTTGFMPWEALDIILVKQHILFILSAEEENDTSEEAEPPLFTITAFGDILPLALENGLLELRDYDGAFDLCTSTSVK